MQARTNWLNNLAWQASFYHRGRARARLDGEWDWEWFEQRSALQKLSARRKVREMLRRIKQVIKPRLPLDWIHANADNLWQTRGMLADEMSKLLFDSMLLMRTAGHRSFYFPRTEFEDLVTVLGDEAFTQEGMPHDYLGLPLRTYDLRLDRYDGRSSVKVISTKAQIVLLNSYRQYLIQRNGRDFSPRNGDVLLDCGACIGEVSTLFAALVGPTGQMHAFDPVPLHIRYCQLQKELNPALASSMYLNTLAVGDRTYESKGAHLDAQAIDPGPLKLDSFACTTLDDYASAQLDRVDFIKMDIEGAEMAALDGAKNIIREFKPTLAISGYHKPTDLWEIPQRLMALNPGYQLMFGHHSPVQWESVFYAVDG
jgi:FkbM family methyltransferase